MHVEARKATHGRTKGLASPPSPLRSKQFGAPEARVSREDHLVDE